jgi:rare lipoprotein A
MRITNIKIQIGFGDKPIWKFATGDKLISASLRFAEGKKSSSLKFSVYDSGGKIANSLITKSFLQGGLDVPSEWLKDDNNPPPSTNGGGDVKYQNAATESSEIGTISTGSYFTPEMRAFLDTVAKREVTDSLTLKSYYSKNGTGYFPESEAIAGFPKSERDTSNIGRYQFNKGDWQDAKKAYPDRIKGFTPADQDWVAFYKLNYRGVTPRLLSGDISGALDKASFEWASIPDSKGNSNTKPPQLQPGTTHQEFIDYYNTRLAVYKAQSGTGDSGGKVVSPKGNLSSPGVIPPTNKVIRVLNESTQASFYGLNDGFDSNDKTANGERFNPEGLTAAHNQLPFGSLVRVTWLVNNQSVVVRVNDRGGFNKLGRQIDLAVGAARALSSPGNDAIAAGILNVKLELLAPGSIPPESFSKDTAKKQAGDSIAIAKGQQSTDKPAEVSGGGQQVTVEWSLDNQNYIVSTFIHVGTDYNPFDDITTITCMDASWVLKRRIKNTRYTNITLKGLASAIAKQYGMILSMADEGSTIGNISQIGINDWSFLMRCCHAQNYTPSTVGSVLKIVKNPDPVVTPGGFYTIGNNVLSASISDRAQTDNNNSTGKIETVQGNYSVEINPETGSLDVTGKPNKNDAGKVQRTYTTLPDVTVQPYKNPRPEGKTYKEFQCSLQLFTAQQDLENLTPDTPVLAPGVIPFFNDRTWYVESVQHSWDENGTVTDLSLYIPVKSSGNDSGGNNSTTTATPGTPGETQSVQEKLPIYTVLSYRRGRPVLSINTLQQAYEHHNNSGRYGYKTIDGFANAVAKLNNDPKMIVYDFILAINGNQSVAVPSAISGKVTRAGGNNNDVHIEGNGNRQIIYHMAGLRVKVGDNVLRGQILGTQASIGQSTGTHLHIELSSLALMEAYVLSLRSGNW